MTACIQPLPTDVIHLMAAGEVIDSLAAVVRELAENAIDAGATRITVSLWTDQWRVRLADNGSGMTLADLEQAALPHSTSKIRDSQDLWQIASLGFRGEALHSLAQLAHLEICSRSVESDAGWRLTYDRQGQPQYRETAAMAIGTVVTASHLFDTWLPRRESLPPPAQQLRAIQLTLQQLALCHPGITWQVEQNDHPWFAIWGSASAKQIVPQLVREIQPQDLQDWQRRIAWVSNSGADASLYGVIGLPDRCHRHRPDWVRVAVNGRVVKLPELEQTILTAFRRTLPRERHPVCFLHLRVPLEQVDWNRHPAKTEIYLHQLDRWQTQVAEAIAGALQLSTTYFSDAAAAPRVGQLLKAAESGSVYRTPRTVQPSSDPVQPESSESPAAKNTPATVAPLIPLKAVAQVHRRYILAEHPSGMWLVEQHIAHERVLYEQLADRWQVVPLEPPIVLDALSRHQVEQLQRIGLNVEAFGEQLWIVRTAPEALASRDDCTDALLELSLGGNLDAALVATACRTAIRNGMPLSLDAMQQLLDQWQHTRHPHTCPHGRPIYLSLEESSLSRFFRRHWVIGKSHGIEENNC